MDTSAIGEIIDKVITIEKNMKKATLRIFECEVEKIYIQLWFRGISNCNYELIPNIYRKINGFSYNKNIEKEMFNIFETYIPMFLKKGNFLDFNQDFE
ncbi:hypothetical protein ACWNT8_14755 [Pigmentibacter ruber]